MIIDLFFVWLMLASAVTVFVLVFLKGRLNFLLRILLWLAWLPLLIVTLLIMFFVLNERNRDGQLKRYNPPSSIKAVLNERGRSDFRGLMGGSEDKVCFFYSYGIARQANKEIPNTASQIIKRALPEDDGRWYAIFFAKDKITRIYHFYPENFSSECQARAE